MDVQGRIEIIRELCSFEGRRAGTDAERRAANRVAELLREGGRRAEVEPTYVHPQFGLVQAAHCALGCAGSLIAISTPALGFALVLVAATSMYLDLNYRLYLVRSLFFRRASQNVVSAGRRPAAPLRVIVSAHLDAARTGAIHSPARAARAARLARRIPSIGPFRVLFWSLAALLPLLGLRMAGVESGAISALQLLPTLALLIGFFALVEIELSAVVPGANDNASGVATAISLARVLEADAPENLDLWFVIDGAEETGQEGMRAFVRHHRKRLDRDSTVFIDLDSVGRGELRFETAAGWVTSYPAGRRLVELCEAIAEADAESDRRFRAEPLRRGSAGDALPPRLAGFRSIAITCRDSDGLLPDHHLPSDEPNAIEAQALERAHDFTLELIRALDRDAGRVGETERAGAIAA